MANLSFYGSHNATYVVEDKGEILLVLEVERFLNYKNSGMAQYMCPKILDIYFLSKYIPEYIMNSLNIKEFDNCYTLNTDIIYDGTHDLAREFIPTKNFITSNHHKSHAAGCFYQSPFDSSLIFSFDGGGDDGKFNIYIATRENSVELLESVNNPKYNYPHIKYDLGFPFMIFSHFLNDIKFEDISIGNLVYPGKIMGLSSYGKIRNEWLNHFIEFYKSDVNGINYMQALEILGNEIGLIFDVNNRFKGEIAYDIAATSQRAFEECFLEVAKPYIEKYPDLPICMAGGCALNIILNTRIKEEFKKEVFVGPNPNDCGIALGIMLHEIKPKKQIDVTYSGTKLLDIDTLGNKIQNQDFFFKSSKLDLSILADDLINGSIVGVARGRSEHGPRALGNRSILCDPSIPNMKDILNQKVKHREWYRPFAPVVRLEDVSKYFHWEGESRFMSFCPKVREEWREKLDAITHIDGTARVQTVTREQNEFLYDLLTIFNEKRGIGVLLNTSFNVDGKPILSTIEDAFKIFKESEMSGLILEGYYLKKCGNPYFTETTFSSSTDVSETVVESITLNESTILNENINDEILMDMSDFYFIYYVVGPQFIKTMMVTFKYIPENVNVIVMTPTPEILKNINVKFNLIVLDSNELVDDFSRQYEPIIKETDDELYVQKLIENYEKNVRFSSSTHRYILPWLIEKGITKFALLDADCLINFNDELKYVYKEMKNKYNGKNVLFGPHTPTVIHDLDTISYTKDIFENEGIGWEIIENIELPSLTFDGWLRGFWFNDVNLLKKYFNLWDGIIKSSHKTKSLTLNTNVWTVPDEWILALINKLFNTLHDVDIDDFHDPYFQKYRIVKHIYHPENDFFSLHHDYLYKFMYGLEIADSRKDFFEKNKENLIKFYKIQNVIEEEKINEVIYDYKK